MKLATSSLATLAQKLTRRLRVLTHRISTHLRPLTQAPKNDPVLPGSIRVSTARMTPHACEIASGGRVKLLALKDRFIESDCAHVLYLVSSALPPDAPTWIERAKKLGIPVVLNQNGVAMPGWAGSLTDTINAPLRHALEQADTVLYQSKFCQHSADRFLGSARVPTQVVYNAVNLNVFMPRKEQQESRPLTVLLGGSQYQKYRVESALESFALFTRQTTRYRDARLIVSGKVDWQNSPHRSLAEARALCRSLEIADRVEFTGPFFQADAPALYARADILLHPKYNDPCPTAVIEALACGLGVVHSSSGGVPELVPTAAGARVTIEQSYDVDHIAPPEAWAQALIELAERLPSAKIAARQCAIEYFGVTHWLDVHEAAFRSVLSQP